MAVGNQALQERKVAEEYYKGGLGRKPGLSQKEEVLMDDETHIIMGIRMELHDEARCLWEQPAQNIAKRYSCYESGGDNPGLPATLQAGL